MPVNLYRAIGIILCLFIKGTMEKKPDQEISPGQASRHPASTPPGDLEARRRNLEELWRRSEEIKAGKRKVEQERERIAEIVLRDGGIRILASIPRELSARYTSGFQSLETRIQDGLDSQMAISTIQAHLLSPEEAFHGKRTDNIMEEHGIKEIIHIRRDMKPIFETVTTPGKKGVLGLGKTPDLVQRKPTGKYEPVFHDEIVSGGKREPAIRFIYFANRSDDWRDYSGRTGQRFVAEIVLPESSAKEVEQALMTDPSTIRKIVEKLMKEKLLMDPDAWERPDNPGADSLRPPYEKWDTQPNGGRIYIQKEDQEPGFRQENFHKI